jgi:hypothetical protein
MKGEYCGIWDTATAEIMLRNARDAGKRWSASLSLRKIKRKRLNNAASDPTTNPGETVWITPGNTDGHKRK